jgi:hypothetical protein
MIPKTLLSKSSSKKFEDDLHAHYVSSHILLDLDLRIISQHLTKILFDNIKMFLSTREEQENQ